MLVDAVVQKGQDLVMENLINIPVDLSDKRGILNDKTSNEQKKQVEHNSDREKSARRRWMRLIGKKNANLSKKELRRIMLKNVG